MSFRLMRVAQRSVPATRVLNRSFAQRVVGDNEALHSRERASEKEYISKTEREQLRKLLAKQDKGTTATTSRTKLHVIFEKHGQQLTPEAEADLRAWKTDGNMTH